MHNIESLHTHTTLSDGKLTHRELFELAESLGVSVLAFTDHDAVPGPEIMAELDTFRGRSTKWIIGTEISAGLPRELASETGTMHIIGLFVDPKNKEMVEHCVRAQESRLKRMEQIVGGLQKLGFIITEKDCLDASEDGSIGRPHIVEALNKYPENNIVMEKIRREMAAEADSNIDLKKRYEYMMERGEKQYPYTLLLTDDAFRTVYAEHDYLPDLDLAVAIIRGAGGLAFIAHYFTIASKMPLSILDTLLAEKRIDGIEVVYGLRAYGTLHESYIEKERAQVRALIKKHNAIRAGGSDAHSKEDLVAYVEKDWFSSEATGLTAAMLATGRVNKKFSSLE